MGRRKQGASGLRMTLATQQVLRTLLTEPTHEFYGLQIGQAAGLPSGTVHPILARLERLGWLESHWEEVDPAEQGRPRRRYYRLTEDGAEHARIALTQSRTQAIDPPLLKPRPAGGIA